MPTEPLEQPISSQGQLPNTNESHTKESSEQNVARFKQILKNRNFVLLWIAQLISLTILNAANFGVVLVVNDLTHSVFMVGLAIIAFTLPALPFSALAGVVVDRTEKRRVLWVSNLLRTATMLALFGYQVFERTNLWPIFILTFLTSLIGQFFIPAEGAAIPLLVGERELMPALSLFNISLTLSQAIGFLLLGRVVATLFPPLTLHWGRGVLTIDSLDLLFAIVAVLYAVCALLILAIPARALHETHLSEHAPQENRTIRGALGALWCDLAVGWRIVRADRLLFFAVVQLSVVGIIMLLIGELAGTFVQEVLHRPAADMTVILAPAAFGLVGASALMPRITERVGKLRLTRIGFVVLASGFLLLPASQWLALRIDPRHGAESPLLFWTTVILVFLLGVAMASVNIPTQTIMQERAPESGRARVLSLQFMLYNTGSIPVLLFAGAIAQFLGFDQLLLLLSGSLLLFCWWGMCYVSYVSKESERKGYERHE